MSRASVDGAAVVDEHPGRLHGGGGQPGGALHAAAQELAGGGPGAAPVPRPARSLQTIIRCYTITLYSGHLASLTQSGRCRVRWDGVR